jgi:hypothetical protein
MTDYIKRCRVKESGAAYCLCRDGQMVSGKGKHGRREMKNREKIRAADLVV